MALKAITDYMKRLNFTPQKPIKLVHKHNRKLEDYVKKKFQVIKKRDYKEKAVVHWLDETRISSNSNYIRGVSPIGKLR